jgi:hypothetical protein
MTFCDLRESVDVASVGPIVVANRLQLVKIYARDLRAEIDAIAPQAYTERGATPTDKPDAERAQSGFERQAAPLHDPENQHGDNGNAERPKAGMDQPQENGRGRARVNSEETRRPLSHTPINIHNYVTCP